ncbi:MAG: bifunctional 3-(3-hydroxy-phenyl)propionate/3-hydroxycinnamic acid hydroxylase [Actinobacteria bacterium]|nr:bifunctional 3-(3-hydroxy-phenyl)propionate/3-hydroxycinnamic acid hydroxylase [Actinomycetota bacterium]
MSTRSAGPWDVVVVGLGPVGLSLVGLLGKRGLRVLGVERERDIYPLPRAGHLDHTILRIIREIGCLDEALAGMIANDGMNLVTSAGEVLARLPVHNRTPSGLPPSMHFHQPSLDRVLRQAVEAMPTTELRSLTEVTGLEQGDQEVRLHVRSGGVDQVVRAGFAVGCDGASSTVRSAAGLELQDFGFEETWVVIDLMLRDRPPSLLANTTFGADPARPYAAIELPGMRYRFEFMLLPGERLPDVTSPEAVGRLISPWLTPGQVEEVERVVSYTFRAARVKDWRRGRVLVAGDAAHLMPPFLGQGMCSGIRDAANLAWKLGHVVREGAPLELLDTYGTERGPHVDNVIHTATRLGKVVCTLDPEAAAERDREMLGGGLPPEQRLTFKLGELAQGPLVLDGGGMFMISPDVRGVPLDQVAGQRFLVLARSAEQLDGPAAAWWRGSGSLVSTLDELPDTEGALRRWMDRRAANVVIVRPDRYVLGAGPSLEEITWPAAGLLADASAAVPGAEPVERSA